MASTDSFEKLFLKWEKQKVELKQHACQMKLAITDQGKAVFKKYGIRKAVLFGSVAKGRCRKTSDIDLLVIPLETQLFWQCRRELEQATQYPVDLYTQIDDPVFVKKILKRGEVIYEAQS